MLQWPAEVKFRYSSFKFTTLITSYIFNSRNSFDLHSRETCIQCNHWINHRLSKNLLFSFLLFYYLFTLKKSEARPFSPNGCDAICDDTIGQPRFLRKTCIFTNLQKRSYSLPGLIAFTDLGALFTETRNMYQ